MKPGANQNGDSRTVIVVVNTLLINPIFRKYRIYLFVVLMMG